MTTPKNLDSSGMNASKGGFAGRMPSVHGPKSEEIVVAGRRVLGFFSKAMKRLVAESARWGNIGPAIAGADAPVMAAETIRNEVTR